MAWVTPINWVDAGHPVGYDVTRADMQTISDDLTVLYSPGHVDASPAYYGWTATPSPLNCFYSRDGSTVKIWVAVAGVSDDGTKSITLPVAVSSVFPASVDIPIRILLDSVAAVGFARLSANSTTLEFFMDINATAWPSAGETVRVDLVTSYPI